jgi:hypothetical protein
VGKKVGREQTFRSQFWESWYNNQLCTSTGFICGQPVRSLSLVLYKLLYYIGTSKLRRYVRTGSGYEQLISYLQDVQIYIIRTVSAGDGPNHQTFQYGLSILLPISCSAISTSLLPMPPHPTAQSDWPVEQIHSFRYPSVQM